MLGIDDMIQLKTTHIITLVSLIKVLCEYGCVFVYMYKYRIEVQ